MRFCREFLQCLLRLMCLMVAAGFIGVHAAEPMTRPFWRDGLVHTAWFKRDGAPTVNYRMTQDERGMLWFASTDGVYRFDGVRFDRLSAIDGNPLRSTNTNGILAVGTALWVGYNFGGVSVFDQGKVRHYGEQDGLPARTVLDILRSRNGTIWVHCAGGLYWLNDDKWLRVTPEDGLPIGEMRGVATLTDGRILVESQYGFYLSAPDTHRFQKIPLDEKYHLVGARVRSDGIALLGDKAGALFRYSIADQQLAPIVQPKGGRPTYTSFYDSRGGLWVNSGGGVTLLGADLKAKHVFSAPELSGKLVYGSLEDREGNLWITTENGVDRIREARLTTIDLPPQVYDWVSVQAGHDGTLWVSDYRDTVELASRTMALTPQGDWIAAPASHVSHSTRAADGTLWFGSSKALWRRQKGQWQSWPMPPAMGGFDVQALAVDGKDRLWVSVPRRGVFVFRDGQWQPGGGVAALAGRPAVSLFADGRQRLWFGYPASHVAVLDGTSLREFGPADGLDVGNVTTMARHQGRLYVGGDQGLAVLDGERFQPVLTAAGQALGGVSALVSTRGGELWLHGIDGLARIGAAVPGTGGLRVEVERFDYLDGYQGKPALMRPLAELTEAPDGRLWYATSGSVGWIDPAHIPRNPLPPSPQITALRTDRRSWGNTPGIVLPQHTTDLQLDFTAAVLSIPERVRFRYRLMGQDKDWRESDGRRAAFYTNLAPGNYRFEVMAANEDGVWSTAPAALAFRIEPAFVQTMWFKVLCVLLFLLLVALLYWWRLALATRRMAERLGERQRERERIARTLHDNFLQSVQALMMQFDLIKYSLPPTDAVQEKIELALDTADSVLAEGREQVLALRLNHELSGDLEAALEGLGEILGPRHGARFALVVQGEPRPLRPRVAVEAYAIAREAMLNAFRHARSEEVTVELRYADRQFTLQVRDAGRGMSAEVLERGHRPGHWGLVGMRERAHDAGGTLEIKSAPGQGTRITLRLSERRAYTAKVAAKADATVR